MQYPSYKIAQFASDYEKGNTATQQEFLGIVKKEILSNLQNYVKKSAEDLDAKVLEYQQKLLDAIKKWKYDSADVKKWIANKITPLARLYAQELSNNLKQQKTKKQKEVPEYIEEIIDPNLWTDDSAKSVIENIPKQLPIPRPYQEQASEKMRTFVQHRKNGTLSSENKQLLSAFLLHQTMWTGKTIEIGMFMEWFAGHILPDIFPWEKLRILVLSNKIETIQRQYETLFHGRDRLGPVFSEWFIDDFYVKEFHSSATKKSQSAILSKWKKIEDHNMMILSTFQSASDRRIQNIVKKHGQFHIVWVDEWHHLPAAEFHKAATQYLIPHENWLLPLMPVTTWTSTIQLEKLVGAPIFEYGLAMYLASEYAPYVEYNMIFRSDLSQWDIEAIHEAILTQQSEKNILTRSKKIKGIADDIDKLFAQFDSMGDLFDDIYNRLEDLSGTIYFCPSIEFAEQLTQTINEKMWDTYHARSYHSDDRYSDAFKQFRKWELAQIVVIDMLNESVHPGNVNNIILLRKTDSFIVYFQQLGRWLTWEYVKVLDYVWSFKNFITANSLYNQVQTIRSQKSNTEPKSSKQRFSIISSTWSTAIKNNVSSSVWLNLLSVMRQASEIQSWIEYTKATKYNIVQLRKDGILKDEDMTHHKYNLAAKKINQKYDTYWFVIPESINGLIGVLWWNPSFDTSHEYIMALLHGVDYVRGRPFLTTEQFLAYVKNEKIPMEALHESKWTSFAIQKNATEEFPFLLYAKFRHLCQMMMGIGRKWKYTTEMFHAFAKWSKDIIYKPFATIDDYKNLYTSWVITVDILKYQNRKSFAEEYNKNPQNTYKLHENRGSLRQLCWYNDGKYVQKIIMGDEIKRDPTRAELIDAWEAWEIAWEHLDRKKWPSHAEYLNQKNKDADNYIFTFPLTFDAFIKIMEETKYKKFKTQTWNYSYPKDYIKSLFTGKDYKPPLPKATQENYKQLAQEWFISQDKFWQFTRRRFARTWNNVYGKKYGFVLHESYQSAIAAIINADDKKSSRTQEMYAGELESFFSQNKKILQQKPVSIQEWLSIWYSAAWVVEIRTKELIEEFTKKANEHETTEDWNSALESRLALKDLDPRNKLYQQKIRETKKKL